MLDLLSDPAVWISFATLTVLEIVLGIADGLHFHVERAFIYSAMIFSGAVEALNLWRGKNARKRRAARAASVPARAVERHTKV